MSESMTKPWIRDYFTDIAETHGAQLYNAPVSNKKRKVQLTDLLTYPENSYIWAWISDKDYKISVRISKDAVDKYKSNHGRSIVDSRFFLVFVSNFRPMFSPRPLGPNAFGNTPTSHISLEIDHVSLMGTGGHLFGNPRDLESDETMKEWVLGLRQDGGGGNVLKLRKQQQLVQIEKASPSPPPLPSPLTSHDQVTDAAKDVVEPKPERPRDFKRAYTKRWRRVEVDPWKFATKPAVEAQPMQTEPRHPSAEPLLNTEIRLESRLHEPSECPTTPHRASSPTYLRRQGTPSNWSPSNRGSPVPPDVASTSALENGIQEHDEPQVLPTTSHPPSDTEGHTSVDTAIASDTRSLQLPTPAQRVKRSSIRHSSPPRSSPMPFACSPPRPSQQLPLSSPPLPSSSPPFLSSSLSIPMGIRKNIQRKVPHPGLHVSPPDPTKRGPVQILVPNSDTSGTGSSQSYSQLPYLSQSQQHQSQSLSHSSNFPSSLAKEFQPPDASTPKEEKPVNASRRTSKMFARSSESPIHDDEEETTLADDKHTTGGTDTATGKQRSELNLPPISNDPKIEVKPDTEETDELQPGSSTIQTVELDTRPGTQDTGGVDTNIDQEHGRLPADKVQTHSTLQDTPLGQPSRLAAASVAHHASLEKGDTGGVAIRERSGSQSPMHSLFSDPLADERRVFSYASIRLTEDKVQEDASPSHVPSHDSEAWKMPSFMAKNKGKKRVLEEPHVPESPRPKRIKNTVSEVQQMASAPATTWIMEPKDTEDSTILNTQHNRASTSLTDTTEATTNLQLSKPRLSNFVVDLERINLGKRVPMPRMDLGKDLKSILLRTGRIRTLGEKAQNDATVYITK